MKKTQTKSLIIVLLGLVATLMIFFPALAYENSENLFKGYEVAFGKEIASLGTIVNGHIGLNVFAIAAYFLPIIASLIVYYKRAYILAVILFAVSAVLFFLMPQYTTVAVTIFNTTTPIEIDWVMSYGLIIAGVSCILGFVASLYLLVKKGKR